MIDPISPTLSAMVPFRCQDYYGIRLVQQLRGMPDKMKARAEVAVFMHNFDEAEAIYRYALIFIFTFSSDSFFTSSFRFISLFFLPLFFFFSPSLFFSLIVYFM